MKESEPCIDVQKLHGQKLMLDALMKGIKP